MAIPQPKHQLPPIAAVERSQTLSCEFKMSNANTHNFNLS